MPVKYNRPVKRSPKSDPQQYRVYRCEKETIGAGAYVKMRLKEMQTFARAICRSYKMPQVEVRFKDLGEWGAEWRPPNQIVVNYRKRGMRNLITMAHELAHHLHEHIAPGNTHQGHGPEFLACYMRILDTARIIPVVGMRAVLDSYKLKYNDPGTKTSWNALTRAVNG